MNARVYDPDIGRFLSPDPTIPYAHNPQSFNRYSYAMNNPLNRVDLDGFSDDPQGQSQNSEASTGCNTCSLSKESVSNATAGKGPSTNTNSHDKQTASIPDADNKSPGQEHDKEVHKLGSEIARKGEVAMETVAKETFFAALFGGVGRLASGLATNLGRFAGKVAGLFRSEASVAGASVDATAARNLAAALSRVTLQKAGFAREGVPIILDENLAAKGMADALRMQGYNVRSVAEIFGQNGIKDPVIRAFAETNGARVLTADRGRQIGEGFGQLAIQVPGRVGANVDVIGRILSNALK
jgi:Domain of unknown function (DUF5615)